MTAVDVAELVSTPRLEDPQVDPCGSWHRTLPKENAMFDYSESDTGPGLLAPTRRQAFSSRKVPMRSTAWVVLALLQLANPLYAAVLATDRGAQDVFAYISNQPE